MDPSRRQELEKLALERLEATADDAEQWSFLFRTDGALGFRYCPWSKFENEDCIVMAELLDLPWSSERLAQIQSGEAPDELELHQWQRAMCRYVARGGMEDQGGEVSIVPIREGGEIQGYALWLTDYDTPYDEAPEFRGIFDSIDEAKALLRAEGELIEESETR